MDGEHLLDTDEKLQYAPSGEENSRIGDLQENFNYSCTIQEGIPSQEPILYGEHSDPCHFSTDYGGIFELITSGSNVNNILLFFSRS